MRNPEAELVGGVMATAGFRQEVLALCERAYAEPLSELFDPMLPVLHVVTRDDVAITSHAMWVDRWLAPSGDEPTRTAYVEFVATDPAHRGRGLATAVLVRMKEEIRARGYAVSALSPATYSIYERLGWRLWEGSLVVRLPGGDRLETPDEEVMVMDFRDLWAGRWHEPLSIEWREGEVW